MCIRQCIRRCQEANVVAVIRKEGKGCSSTWNISRFAPQRRSGQAHCNSDGVITCAATDDILPEKRARARARDVQSRENTTSGRLPRRVFRRGHRARHLRRIPREFRNSGGSHISNCVAARPTRTKSPSASLISPGGGVFAFFASFSFR